MIEILKSILYGIVEGITEWLPISSTGHMILLEEIMPMNVSKSFWSMFLVVIQLGAILAVVVLYWNKIFPFKKNKEGKYTSVKSIWILWSKILVATIPAAIIGLALDDWIDAHLYNGFVVAIMLILVGVAFIYIENRNKDMCPSVNSLSALSYKDALIIGLFQVVAAFVGKYGAIASNQNWGFGGATTRSSNPNSNQWKDFVEVPSSDDLTSEKINKIVELFKDPSKATVIESVNWSDFFVQHVYYGNKDNMNQLAVHKEKNGTPDEVYNFNKSAGSIMFKIGRAHV